MFLVLKLKIDVQNFKKIVTIPYKHDYKVICMKVLIFIKKKDQSSLILLKHIRFIIV